MAFLIHVPGTLGTFTPTDQTTGKPIFNAKPRISVKSADVAGLRVFIYGGKPSNEDCEAVLAELIWKIETNAKKFRETHGEYPQIMEMTGDVTPTQNTGPDNTENPFHWELREAGFLKFLTPGEARAITDGLVATLKTQAQAIIDANPNALTRNSNRTSMAVRSAGGMTLGAEHSASKGVKTLEEIMEGKTPAQVHREAVLAVSGPAAAPAPGPEGETKPPASKK